VAGNLPWVAAACLGGLPVAAGVYVATKVFQNQVDQVSSAVYSLEGSWDDPQLNFKKFYAGQLSDKKAIKAAQDAAQAAEQEQGQEQGQEQEQEQGQEQDLDPDTAADPDTLKEPG
jgi:hypothetical protein